MFFLYFSYRMKKKKIPQLKKIKRAITVGKQIVERAILHNTVI